jgi:Bacterial Ig domain
MNITVPHDSVRNNSVHISTRKRVGASRSRVSAVVALSLFAAAIGALALPTMASAATIDAITGVTIQPPDPAHPDRPLVVGQRIRVDATWAVPNGTQPGDSFSLSFPAPVRAVSGQFDLLDPQGHVVGNCVVSRNSFLCTMNDFVLTHTNVHGTLHFWAHSAEATNDLNLTFTTGTGTPIRVPIPGGSIVTPAPAPGPTAPNKNGYLKSDGQTLGWIVLIPGVGLTPLGGNPVVLTDTYDSALTFVSSTLRVSYIPTASWGNSAAWVSIPAGSGANTYSIANDPAHSTFDLTFNGPVTDGSRIYRFSYDTSVPADAADGTVFADTITVSGRQIARDTVTFVNAGGDGSGTVIPPVVKPTPKPTTGPGGSGLPTTGGQLPTLALTGQVDHTPQLRLALILLIAGVATILIGRRRTARS